MVAGGGQQLADGGMQDIDAGVDGVRQGGFFAEAGHQSGRAGVHDAVGAGHRHGEDGCQVAGVGGAAGGIVGEQGGKRGVGDDVAVEGDDGVGVAGGQARQALAEGAAPSQGLLFAAVMDADAAVAMAVGSGAVVAVGAAAAVVAEVFGDGVRQVSHQQDGVGDAGAAAEPGQLARQDGASVQGQHGFGQRVGERAEALALAAGQYQGVHWG